MPEGKMPASEHIEAASQGESTEAPNCCLKEKNASVEGRKIPAN